MSAPKIAEIAPQRIREFIAHTGARGIAPINVGLDLAPVRALFTSVLEDGTIRSNRAPASVSP